MVQRSRLPEPQATCRGNAASARIIGTRVAGTGQAADGSRRSRAKSLRHQRLSASIESCASIRLLLGGGVSRSSCRPLVGGLLRPQRPRHRGSRARLPRLHGGARRDRRELRRQGRVRIAWSTARSTACCRRSTRTRASWIRACYAQMRERQEGRYYGLGITIVVIDGDITVVSLFEGSPAYKKGIRRGDVIARIDGEDAKGWTSDQAVQAAARAEGHDRAGLDQAPRLRPADRARGAARRDQHPVDSARTFMIDARDRLRPAAGLRREHRPRPGPGAARRSSASGHEAPAARPARQPGRPARPGDPRRPTGSCPQGVADRLHARARARTPTRTTARPRRASTPSMPLVVLVNRNSASASEIVSGALQDHDRGLIVGETTFGKALVQSVYRISEGAGLALTTARYYTPSERLIQRPWDGTFDEYLTYTLRDQDAERPARGRRPAVHRRRAQGVQRRRHRARPAARRPGRGLQPDAVRPAALRAAGRSRPSPSSSRPRATRASRRAPATSRRVAARLRRRRRDARGLQGSSSSPTEGRRSTRRRSRSDVEFIRAMIHYDIDLALFGVVGGAPEPDRQRPAGAVRAAAVPGGRAARRARARRRGTRPRTGRGPVGPGAQVVGASEALATSDGAC